MKSLIITGLLFLSSTSFAQFGFVNVTQTDLQNIIEELSNNSTFSSLSPASSNGDIFGFQLGVVAGSAASPEVEKVVKRSDPQTSVPNLYHAGILGAVSAPFGITGELFILPTYKNAGASFSQTSYALKWTFFEFGLFSFAARYFMTDAKLTFNQIINTINMDVTIDNKVNGLQLLASHDFLFVEPYIGIGSVNGNGDVTITGTTTDTFFASASQRGSASGTSTQTILGAQFNLAFFKLGLETSSAFNKQKYDVKLAVGF